MFLSWLLLTDIYDIVIIVSEAHLLQHDNLRHIGRATPWSTSVTLVACYLSLVFKVRHLIPTMKYWQWVCRPSASTGICGHRSQTTGCNCSQHSRHLYPCTGTGVYMFISVTGTSDGPLSQAVNVLDNCVVQGAQLHTIIMWVQHTVMSTMLNDPSEVNTWKWN